MRKVSCKKYEIQRNDELWQNQAVLLRQEKVIKESVNLSTTHISFRQDSPHILF